MAAAAARALSDCEATAEATVAVEAFNALLAADKTAWQNGAARDSLKPVSRSALECYIKSWTAFENSPRMESPVAWSGASCTLMPAACPRIS